MQNFQIAKVQRQPDSSGAKRRGLFARWRRVWVWMVGGAIALLLSASSPGWAQSDFNLASRVARIELDVSQLRSQLSQLAAQQNRPSPPRPPGRSTPAPRPGDTPLAEDPTFRRLATLVIELRDRIATLEAEVAELQRAQ